jgi:hypothetical protein
MPEFAVNRVVYTECNVAACPCGERCSNQRIQRRNCLENSIQKFITVDRGYGVRTTRPITAGQSVSQSVRQTVALEWLVYGMCACNGVSMLTAALFLLSFPPVFTV